LLNINIEALIFVLLNYSQFDFFFSFLFPDRSFKIM